jgi:hypothetical protein
MPLPKLETPTYEMVLPSTNKKIKYRPFLVKEYKILLSAIDADTDEITRIVKELIDVCTFNKIDIEKLAHFDLEYLFLQIRAKSISEITNIFVNCDCGEKIPFALDITKAEIENKTKQDNKILIDDSVGVEMRYPKFEEILDLYENTTSEKAIEIIKNCVNAVFTKDNYMDRSTFTDEELTEFLNSFTKKQIDKLEEFFNKRPKVVQHIDVQCPSCGTHNKTSVEGIQNFFV